MSDGQTSSELRPPADTRSASFRGRLLRMAFVIVPVAGFLAFLAIGADQSQPRNVGNPAPSFDLETLDGSGRLSSSDFEGEAYAVNFWASWCLPCREEAPHLARVAGDGTGVPRFFGISMLDSRSAATDFVDEFGIRYANLLDDGRAFRAFGVVGIPETVFVSAEGTIAGRWRGAIEEEDLERILRELLELGPGETLTVVGSGPAVGVP
jgi:cytochrome c biogenesis protein CcmG, thiol:disulfide interchange protein DsbE